jgi:hypothetical protein
MRKQMMDKEIPNNEAIWKLYSPTPNHWFVSEINYEGWGIASFGKPVGTIEGKTLIHVDEIGNLDIEMECEKLNTDAAVSGSGSWKIQKFLHGNFASVSQSKQKTAFLNQKETFFGLPVSVWIIN